VNFDSLMPFYRTQVVANRVLSRQPDPPRQVPVGEVLWIYAPILTYGFGIYAGLGAALVLLTRPGARASTLPIVVLALVGGALFIFGMFTAVSGPLRKGVAATGEILTVGPGHRGGQRGRVRVEGGGRRFEADYGWAGNPALAIGNRVGLLADPVKNAVLLILGPTAGN
jgi:hypothetical protein